MPPRQSSAKTTAKKKSSKSSAKTKAKTKPKPKPKRGATAKKNSLVENINRRKRLGTSRPKSRSTVSKAAYVEMEAGGPSRPRNPLGVAPRRIDQLLGSSATMGISRSPAFPS